MDRYTALCTQKNALQAIFVALQAADASIETLDAVDAAYKVLCLETRDLYLATNTAAYNQWFDTSEYEGAA